MKKLLGICVSVFTCLSLWAQGEIDDQEIILFQNERSVAATLNSNGFSASFRFGQRKTYLSKIIYDIELAYIKHPKEIRGTSPYAFTNRKYVYGKTNIFVDLRPSIGFQREIFSKEDRGSIAIKYYYAGGPSIGFAKPIYYTFYEFEQDGTGYYYVVDTHDEKFEYFEQASKVVDIAYKASFWKGFNEIKLFAGLHAKFGMSFEYSTINRIVNAVDAGIIIEAFHKKIPIMYTSDNKQFFLTLFVSYRFGWIIDARYKTPRDADEGIALPE